MGRLSAALLLAVFAATPAAADQRFTLEMSIDVYVGGMHGMKAAIKAERQGARYRVESRSQTLGLIDSFLNWRSMTHTVGKWSPSGPVPRLHRYRSASRWGERSVVTDYFADGRVETAYFKKGKKAPFDDDRVPIPNRALTGSLDLLTAILAATAGGNNKSQPCGRRIPVFDGRRRYDVELLPAGSEALKKSKYSAYKGPAVKCRLAVTPIGGFTKQWMAEAAARRAQGEKPFDITVWFAADGKQQLHLPVRAEARNWLGWLIVHLSSYRYAPTSTWAAEN